MRIVENKMTRKEYISVSIPKPLSDKIDKLIQEGGRRHWPTRAAFVRDACADAVEQEESKFLD